VVKRRSEGQSAVPPEPPAWILPATSPSQVISPPLHPGLFFHPTPSAQSMHGLTESSMGRSESGSDYGSEGEGEGLGKLSAIPIVEGLGTSYTPLPPRNPRKPRDDQTRVNERKIRSLSRRPNNVTPAAKALKRNPTAPASNTKSTPSSISRSTKPTSTPTTLKRSSAIQDLAQASPTSTIKRAVKKRESTAGSKGTTISASSPLRPKSRLQKREEKAQGKVEDILKASWSDRAILASPPPEDLGHTGLSSPGVQEAAVMASGGIEQRLELLRKMGDS
jgi:hypothetical protein